MSLIRYIGLFLFSMMTGFCGLGVKNKSEVKFFCRYFSEGLLAIRYVVSLGIVEVVSS